MYLTITTTSDDPDAPATDLGFLLHKHPGRAQSFAVSAGTAHVFYPEATAARCTAALFVEVDPVALVRGRVPVALDGYVNDRPYVASSLLAVALPRVFGSALHGRCTARPDLVGRPLPLTVRIPVLPAGRDGDLVRRWFTPLGWTVRETRLPLDEEFGQWGPSGFVDAELTATMPLDRALTQLYVLLPALDDDKHYWVGDDEVDKLARAGGDWLAHHPERDLILRRSLARQRDLVDEARTRLTADDPDDPDDTDEKGEPTATTPVAGPGMARLRLEAVLTELRAAGANRVVDMGCGEGHLVAALLREGAFSEVVGVDVAARELARAEKRLALERMPDAQRARLQLLQSSVTYRDRRLAGYDAMVLMEVVEHLEPEAVPALVRTVFADARPRTVVLTTPNADHNVRYPALAGGGMRHPDHRFEWTRAEFTAWTDDVAAEHGYTVRLEPVGPDDPEVGPSTQLAVFTRVDADVSERRSA
ncbi:3' terminal RNA ribose 2'-O-methyltransferase Hen1 [Nakamurella flavida]|uniref:3' terminal RNA ribose 2'-O-methyltransferase Hen1 n=1 Tax=Nakamurella flavida TaxID=363630 RepID=UPI002780BC9A|nr:3' terminal RNA ribose 2'-O-methyltransferase Hen1 [Nakamurella flavida]MDP9778533.1 3' terminal RNA ribose 2'-O-methyltransferase Hen1 [Nakamurella flavida]